MTRLNGKDGSAFRKKLFFRADSQKQAKQMYLSNSTWLGIGSIMLATLLACSVAKSLPGADDATKQKEINDKMTNVFKKYYGFSPDSARPAFTSDKGDAEESRPEVDVAMTPSFKERVAITQRQLGQKPTGVPDEKLVNMVQRPRCGIFDPPTDENAPGAYKVRRQWRTKYVESKGQLQLTYSFLTQYFPSASKLTDEEVRKGVLSAMCIWEWTSNVRFIKDMGDNKANEADITFAFVTGEHGDRNPFDGEGDILAHGFFPENGALHFDGDEPWYLAVTNENVSNKKDIFTVAVHELGHNLGLDHSDQNAIMGPYYTFRKAFQDFQTPRDDIDAMASMYGFHKASNPENEESACRQLATTYGLRSSFYNSNPIQPAPSSTTTPPKRSSTTRTTTTTTTARSRTGGAKKCEDEVDLGGNCLQWKEWGYCTDKAEQQSMMHLCKRTCGFCAGTPNDDNTAVNSICEVSDFDAVVTTYDFDNSYDAYVFKEDYYTRMLLRIMSAEKSLLQNEGDLGNSLVMLDDPKTIKPGVKKIESSWENTKSVASVLKTGNWFLVFDGNGYVDQYSSYTQVKIHFKRYKISEIFRDYPHDTVDAAYYEDPRSGAKTYILFKGDRMWQYEDSKSQIVDSSGSQWQLHYSPIVNRTNLDISQWHGVGACNVDSVFKYKGVPYFLKGSTFWPAHDQEPAIGRDFAYHFFRCSEPKRKTYDSLMDCSAGTITSYSTACFILSHIFALFIFYA